jgi:phosphohistidine phosphatase
MDDPALWAGQLAQEQEDVMLVGHLPHLARLASLLLCGDQARSCVDFEMAGMVCLRRFEDGHWSAAWLTTPAITG